MTIIEASTQTASLTLPAPVLRDLLAGALLAASRDTTMPVLSAVHLAWEVAPERGDALDGALITTATDRYRMNEGRTQCAVMAAGEALVSRTDADALVKTLPKAGRLASLDADAIVMLDGDALVVEVGGNVRRLPLVDGEYPKVGKLWPDPQASSPVASVSLNPALVADIAKIPLARKGFTYWRWTFFIGEHGPKPVLAEPAPGSEHDRIAWRALVMPARLPN